jgi:cellobiose-specific phosphotransferase system component IIC
MTLTVVAIVWGIFTVGLIILLIYRSTLTMQEEEQLFLDDANSHMQQEQTELLTKVNRLRIPVWVFGGGSGVFLLVLLFLWISQRLAETQ